jgi:PKHD-type hydroxylase
MNKYFTIKEFLSEQECDDILNFSISNLQLKKGKIGNNEIYEKTRKSSIAFSNYDKIFPFIKEKLIKEISKKVKLKGFELNFDEPFQFTKYDTGEYYEWHADSHTGVKQSSERYCSVVIQLNNEYTAGDLQIKDLINEEEIIDTFEKGKGNLFVFLSHMVHRVSPIETGIRYSLVTWFKLKPVKDYKKTLI